MKTPISPAAASVSTKAARVAVSAEDGGAIVASLNGRSAPEPPLVVTRFADLPTRTGAFSWRTPVACEAGLVYNPKKAGGTAPINIPNEHRIKPRRKPESEYAAAG